MQIITESGTTLFPQEFQQYCNEEEIRHIMINTELLRASRKVEHLNYITMTPLSKYSLQDLRKWFLQVNAKSFEYNWSKKFWNHSVPTAYWEMK